MPDPAPTAQPGENRSPIRRTLKDGASILLGFVGFAFIGFVACLVYAVGTGVGIADGSRIIAASVLVSGAALASGAFIGFLFGIPRTVARSDASDREGGYDNNTNLEQISDWLTKVIVGATLTQLGPLMGMLGRLGSYLSPAFGTGAYSAPFVVSLVIYATIGGFFLGYLLTRLFLPGALTRSDREIRDMLNELLVKTIERDSERELRRLLYIPQGYRQVIEQIPKALEEAKTPKSKARFNAYAACAYGQLHRELRTAGADASQLAAARSGALSSAKKAVELNPDERGLLKLVLQSSLAGEDDLADFREDEDFLRVIQPPA